MEINNFNSTNQAKAHRCKQVEDPKLKQFLEGREFVHRFHRVKKLEIKAEES